MTGETISHYRVLDKIGEGGMGVVYKAEDLHLRRFVALKFLNEKAFGISTGRTRFLYEAQAAAVIEHPNVCPVYGFEESGDYIFIVMAFVEGVALEDLLDRGVSHYEAVRIAIEIGEGLKAAHGKRVVHRDIKPGNILITADGQVKITDFGLALLAERTRITKPGTVMGTVAYMSPEQAQSKPVDRRSDIWSLGAVLYEMIGGSPPFRGKDLHSMLASVIQDPLPELRPRNAPLPSFLKSIVGKAMAKNPDERYQHVDDFIVDLRGVLRDMPADTEAATQYAARAGDGGAALAATQTMIAPGGDGNVNHSPLKAAMQYISGKLRGRSNSK